MMKFLLSLIVSSILFAQPVQVCAQFGGKAGMGGKAGTGGGLFAAPSASYVSQSYAGCSGFNSGTLTCAVGGTGIQSASDILIAFGSIDTAASCGSTTTTLTSGKATWTLKLSLPNAANNVTGFFYTGVPSSTGADTLSLGYPVVGGCLVTIQVFEFVPCSTGAVDQTASNNGAFTAATSGTTATTAHACEILIGGVFGGPNSGTTATSPFTAIGAQSDLGTVTANVSYDIVAATGTYQAAWTLGTSSDWSAGIITLF